jgi:hypothetical protein
MGAGTLGTHLAPSARFLAALVFFLVLRHRNGIDAREPTVEIDIGAAPRAERPELCRHRLAADRAGVAALGIGHKRNMWAKSSARQPIHLHDDDSYSALSQPKWIG